ncbi:PHP domain-containing protein [Amycolatopsis rhabdoformis]|uniref:Histidinol-phosphatase n=1 Tax=Amycolatopsis rhabdoformis TaxID=1448059 RepID=A0ABZ1I3R5_9PSEU|nr:PHP domain-containing protein [Amycolatopsis rhabdoformis]WSE28421.1 PHP domain-containing protein [Amycolatopsis rhabdoformis]
MLPPDSHVHTEWSWDTVTGSMVRSCERALELGLPSLAFTEHADLTPWLIPPPIRPHLPDHFRVRLRADGVLEPPALDVEGYLACVQECRERFPDLRIFSGVELSEPHWHRPQADALLAAHRFERVLGSVHSLPEDGAHYELSVIADRPADQLLRAYLGEVLGLVESTADFEILAHIDYALRTWPSTKPFVATDFEEEFRTVLRALAGSGRALELNTKVPLPREILLWWAAEGGRVLSFGSDAHAPELVGHGFTCAAELAASCGFRAGRTPHDLWVRRDQR